MTKVCPECGGGIFKYHKNMTAVVVCDGSGKTINVSPTEELQPTDIECYTCTHETTMDKLVTEEYFHLVICGDDEGDEDESAS